MIPQIELKLSRVKAFQKKQVGILICLFAFVVFQLSVGYILNLGSEQHWFSVYIRNPVKIGS